jgi:hypothetical protein
LSLAIGWTAGVNILLEAGADPFRATLDAIGREDEVTIKLTLPQCPIFSLRIWSYSKSAVNCSILSYTLWTGSSRNIVRLIVERLAEDRRQLVQLARRSLPDRQLRCLGLSRRNGDLSSLPGNEDSIVAALSQNGIEIPPKIVPCPYSTVYHDENMTVYVANELWAHGFRAIDMPDAWGCTPLLLACGDPMRDKEIICWYLEKRAVSLDFDRLRIRSCLHVAAATFLVHGCRALHEKYIESLNFACGPTLKDSCNCYCSSGGCLPVNLLLKRWETKQLEDWKERSQGLNTWLDLSSINSSEREACYSEVCRLEIFERLGMAHTCCKWELTRLDNACYDIPSMLQMAEDEKCELRNEDEHAGSVQALLAYMQLYESLKVECSEPFSIFWEAWWRTLAGLLPEKWKKCWDSEDWILREVAQEGSKAGDPDEANEDEEDLSRSGNDFGLDEAMIRSRMEFFVEGGGIALLANDIFIDDDDESDSHSFSW